MMMPEDRMGLKFDGTTDFSRFRTKLLAYGALKKGFDKALQNDLDISTTNPDKDKNLELRLLE